MIRNTEKIKDHPDLVKDLDTGMILNINKDKVQKVKAERAAILQQRQELDALKSDVSDIKFMLQKLLENGSNG